MLNQKPEKYILSNKIRVLTFPLKTTAAVTVLVLVKTGSRYEAPAEQGVSHFLEHMAFKGTKKRPSPLEISRLLDSIGADFNAFTSKEFTGFYITCLPKHLELALDVLSDILLHSRLDPKELQKEKGVILEEINLLQDTPPAYVGALFEKLLFPGQALGRLIIGRPESVLSLSRDNLLNYLQSHYLGSRMVISVTGKIESQKVKTQIEKYFQKIPKGSKKAPPKAKIIPTQKPKILTLYKKTDQTHLCLGVLGYNYFDPRRYAFSLLKVILGGSMSSRLFQEIREKKGLAYYIRSSTESFFDTGYLVSQAGVDNQKVARALKIIAQEYQKLAQKKVSSTELKKAKDFIKGKTLLSLESSFSMANWLGLQELLQEKIETLKEHFDKMEAVTTTDIQRISQDIFGPSNLALALIGPFKKTASFKQALVI